MFIFKEKKSKGLGEGCDPRARMNQCNDGLHCYQKSDTLGDGMCVPKWKNGGYVNYRKIGNSEDFECGLFNYVSLFSYLISLIMCYD